MNISQASVWNKSYENKDNFLYFPNEEVIRFTSKYIRKKTGLECFSSIDARENINVLDLGCGIGRHVLFFKEMGLAAYGLDISEHAILRAIELASSKGYTDGENIFRCGDAKKLPYVDGFFSYAVSHGVLDSVTFQDSIDMINELFRVIEPLGLLYCDFIAPKIIDGGDNFTGEEIVSEVHEYGTIQSYFDRDKIEHLFENKFQILEISLIKKVNLLTNKISGRYHVVAKNLRLLDA